MRQKLSSNSNISLSNKVLCFRISNLKILFRKNPNPQPVLPGVLGVLPGAGVLLGVLPGVLQGILQGILHVQRKKNLKYHEVLIGA